MAHSGPLFLFVLFRSAYNAGVFTGILGLVDRRLEREGGGGGRCLLEGGRFTRGRMIREYWGRLREGAVGVYIQ